MFKFKLQWLELELELELELAPSEASKIVLTPMRAKMVTKVIKVSTKRPFTIRFIVFLTRRLGLDSKATGFLGWSFEEHFATIRLRKPCFTSTFLVSFNSSGSSTSSFWTVSSCDN